MRKKLPIQSLFRHPYPNQGLGAFLQRIGCFQEEYGCEDSCKDLHEGSSPSIGTASKPLLKQYQISSSPGGAQPRPNHQRPIESFAEESGNLRGRVRRDELGEGRLERLLRVVGETITYETVSALEHMGSVGCDLSRGCCCTGVIPRCERIPAEEIIARSLPNCARKLDHAGLIGSMQASRSRSVCRHKPNMKEK